MEHLPEIERVAVRTDLGDFYRAFLPSRLMEDVGFAASGDNRGVSRTLHLNPANRLDLARAAEILRLNGTVAFPTETVYGLGANALYAEAVEKIFIAKQRPHWDPLIVHIASRDQLPGITRDVSPAAEALMAAFWPGPLTLLLPRTEAVPDVVTAGRAFVGIRIPAHPVAQGLLREAGIPIAAPSANTFGHTSPTTAAHVLADLDGRIDAILDGGPTEVGLESTVAEVRRYEVVIYREGAVTVAMVEQVLGPEWHVHVHVHRAEPATRPPESLPSPGVGIRHYAPRARLLLTSTAQDTVDMIDAQMVETEIVGVLLPDRWNASAADHIFPWGSWHEPEVLAKRLYAGLRHLDDEGCTVIVAPVPESPGIAGAIRDRLQKASFGLIS